MLKLTNSITIEELLEAITKYGCNCDIMSNMFCCIHVYINRLRRILYDKGAIE